MGEVADIVGGGTPRTNDPANFVGGDIPWITPADLSGYRGKFITKGARNITSKGLEESGARLMPAGTVLFSSRAPIGYVAIAAQPVCTNQGFKSFVLPECLSSDYVYYHLQRAKELAVALASGTTFLEISGAKAALIPFPVAPIQEQHRIVAAIEEQFSRLDAAVASLERARAGLKRYRAAVLAAACSGRLVPGEVHALPPYQLYGENDTGVRRVAEARLSYDSDALAGAKSTSLATPAVRPVPTESESQGDDDQSVNDDLPKHWRKVKLGELAKVGTGATPLRSRAAYYENGTIPWITSGALNHPVVRDASEFVTDFALRSTNLTLYPVHSLLIAMYGEGRTRGRCSELMIEATTNQAIAALVFAGDNERVRPWVKLFLTRSYEVMRNQATGGVQPNLNLSIVRNLDVPLPPLAEQHRIVAEVERRLSVVDELDAIVAADLKRAERLRQAILRRAFAGELVPQDLSGEPASALLERIKAERTSRPRRCRVSAAQPRIQNL